MKHNKDTFTFKKGDKPAETIKAIIDTKNRIAIFNKISGVLVGFTSVNAKQYLNGELYKWKEVKIDEVSQQYNGDYDTGEVVNIDDLPVTLHETDLDSQASAAIQNEYRWYHEMNLLIGVVRVMVDKHNISGPEVDAFLNMAEFIQEKREANNRYKKAYDEGPDWNLVTKKQVRDNLKKVLEGGIHELLGPESLVLPQDGNNPM